MSTVARRLDFNQDNSDRIQELENALAKATTKLSEQIAINTQNQMIIDSIEKKVIRHYSDDSTCTPFTIAILMTGAIMLISWLL